MRIVIKISVYLKINLERADNFTKLSLQLYNVLKSRNGKPQTLLFFKIAWLFRVHMNFRIVLLISVKKKKKWVLIRTALNQ